MIQAYSYSQYPDSADFAYPLISNKELGKWNTRLKEDFGKFAGRFRFVDGSSSKIYANGGEIPRYAVFFYEKILPVRRIVLEVKLPKAVYCGEKSCWNKAQTEVPLQFDYPEENYIFFGWKILEIIDRGISCPVPLWSITYSLIKELIKDFLEKESKELILAEEINKEKNHLYQTAINNIKERASAKGII